MFHKPERLIKKVFIHCSASDNPKHDYINVIRQWHIERKFSDIGYHYFIHKNGKLSLGRNIEKTPAAQTGYNINTIAICLHGLKRENFTQAQFETLKKLCKKIKIAINSVTFHGHCEVAAKTCPVFDYKSVLQLDSKGYSSL
jgi:N-acetyl-anhydromuramyl-L-alanine amidase AmpD